MYQHYMLILFVANKFMNVIFISCCKESFKRTMGLILYLF